MTKKIELDTFYIDLEVSADGLYDLRIAYGHDVVFGKKDIQLEEVASCIKEQIEVVTKTELEAERESKHHDASSRFVATGAGLRIERPITKKIDRSPAPEQLREGFTPWTPENDKKRGIPTPDYGGEIDE